MPEPFPELAFRSVSKNYPSAPGQVRVVLERVSFEIGRGHRVAIVGRSGSGKSTLLHLAAGVDVPSSGEIRVRGQDLARLPDRDRTLLRRREIGLVFQFFHLLPHLSVSDNVALPELIAGGSPGRFQARIQQLLERVGLEDRAGDNIQQLSGGEMQRVAICRALVRSPYLLLADEPTGNLDDASSGTVMDLMLELAAEEGSTLVYVTHSRELAGRADEVWTLQGGDLLIP